jgi:hypothetical protein
MCESGNVLVWTLEDWSGSNQLSCFNRGNGERCALKERKPKNWSESEQMKLMRMARKGTGASEISARLGRYAGSVRRMARKLGVLLKK